MDNLEKQIKDSRRSSSLDEINKELLKEILGPEAAEELEKMRSITRVLEQAGYIRRKGGKYELTPRGMRKIGEKALNTVFASLKKDRAGGHGVKQRGSGGERIDETKKYEFGDDFDLHLEKNMRIFGLEGSWYIDVINVYNRKNIAFYMVDYDYDPPEIKAYVLLPIPIPSFGFNLRF